ncbi:MAG: hypothetical protein KDK05_25630, partial [Candidatus Competibacteraceae bacterium]|nr:hypothetical protein [Candidatus Competibacteraceae bacterium]
MNSNSCLSTVSVQDTTPPVLICQDVTIYVKADGMTDSNNPFLTGMLVSESDNCSTVGGVGVTGPKFYSCSSLGDHSIKILQDDPSGNVGNCIATLTVLDTTSPTAVCQDITVYLDGSGSINISGSDVDGGSTDNCSVSMLSVSPNNFTCMDIGSNNVTLTVTDASMNSSSCMAMVTVQDTTSPVATCQDITAYLNGGGVVSITAGDVDGGSLDNCAVTNLQVSLSNFSCSDRGPNPVTLTAFDASSNTSSCSAMVTVLDTIPPVAVCKDITVSLDGNGLAVVTSLDLDGGSSDNCFGVTANAFAVFTCSDAGPNQVIVEFTDYSSNSSSCISNVTVEDTTPPTAICQNITVYLDNSGMGSYSPTDLDNGSTDNCSIQSYVSGMSSVSCANLGAILDSLYVYDPSGNVGKCAATITVVDTTSPVADCQNITVYLDASGNASISGNDVDGGSTDNCGITSRLVDPSSFSCANVGSNGVLLTVMDASSNEDTCTATVTVVDTVAPVVSCQNVTVSLDAMGQVSIASGDLDNGSSDACGIVSVVASDTTFDCMDVGGNAVTLTVTDVNGNSKSCISTVTVRDNIAPMARCKDITVILDNIGMASIMS